MESDANVKTLKNSVFKEERHSTVAAVRYTSMDVGMVTGWHPIRYRVVLGLHLVLSEVVQVRSFSLQWKIAREISNRLKSGDRILLQPSEWRRPPG